MSKILPVIHHMNDELAFEQAIHAKNFGCDGVFLISHVGTNDRLANLAKQIQELLNIKVGLNLLGVDILEAAKIVADNEIDMLWGDSCGVSSLGLTKTGEDLKLWKQQHPQIEVFASVAFKYQSKEIDPPLAAHYARVSGFIPTTSGSGTGYAPSIEKIRSMSNNQKQLAVASGMDCDNVHKFTSYLSHILVATGISKNEFEFDIDKMKVFFDIVKNN